MRFELEDTPDTVDFWTDVRLPFEPQGSAKEARERLRSALAALNPTGELTATYSAEPGGLCDLENVLAYNVGSICLPGSRSCRASTCGGGARDAGEPGMGVTTVLKARIADPPAPMRFGSRLARRTPGKQIPLA